MKLTDTIEGIKTTLVEGEVAIAWVDGSRESILLAQIMQFVRKGSPVMIFPEFWTADQNKRVRSFVDGLGVRAFMMSPLKAVTDGRDICTEYKTNLCSFGFRQRYDETFFDKLVTFDARARVIPAYLWARSFIAGEPKNYFTGGEACFPFVDWTPEDFEAAYAFLDTPDLGGGWPLLTGEAEVNGNGNHTTRFGA